MRDVDRLEKKVNETGVVMEDPSEKHRRGAYKIIAIARPSCVLICTSLNGVPKYIPFKYESLLKYTSRVIEIYEPGYRPLTKKEKSIIEGWINYQKSKNFKSQPIKTARDLEIAEQQYYKRNKALYLLGINNPREDKKILKLDMGLYKNGITNCVLDSTIKGVLKKVFYIRGG